MSGVAVIGFMGYMAGLGLCLYAFLGGNILIGVLGGTIFVSALAYDISQSQWK